jgi:glycosyltransferase involved in cell wall biosynthesis
VVIPAFNRAEMLARAIRSVDAQLPDLPAEVIVVDDGSEDATAAVAERLGARVIRHPRNLGLAAARNTGLELATQPWVALLDSDDEWLPHHLAQMWELRGSHVLVASSALRCAEDPGDDQFHGTIGRKPVVLDSADRLVFPGNIIPVSASMVMRDVALAAGGFRARCGVVEDFDLWLRVLERGTGVCSPRAGVLYHLHDEQMSRQDRRVMQLGHLEASEAHRVRTGGSRAPIRRWEAVAAWENLRIAANAGEPWRAARWTLYIGSRPRRVQGLMGILAFHHISRRRARALRTAGVGSSR